MTLVEVTLGYLIQGYSNSLTYETYNWQTEMVYQVLGANLLSLFDFWN